MDRKKLQPIIIKRIKRGKNAGAHGGAWKIAYADFVTAMMAFFLLMWLLGSTSKGDLQGIASYFSNPVKISLMGGDGAGDSTSIITGGGPRLETSKGNAGVKGKASSTGRPDSELEESRKLQEVKNKILERINKRPALSEYKNQIKLEMTKDGLQIDIMDHSKRPMFDIGQAVVKPYLREILQEIGAGLKEVNNLISLSGHTDATQYSSGLRGYSNWELSADRANASRRELVTGGMPQNKLKRIVGMADTDLLDSENPSNPINRRISVVVLNYEAASRLLGDDHQFTRPK
ncbi:flagellar motor protein MotB [Limnohabitans planktonicus]|uniref:Flagellar motor protein MotB n=1 Tax=Limnohabitans planktonicus II-D5 TaxID=1293045 RepID=A0A2T7UIY3_9BURK|nr:flagellar motor protein MotB [Limnohabitans planktonicus]PVE44640.1 flagellar motor protein MotB [Limnohabitans planktonicus II-D5]|eukprot:gene22658-28801_t